MAEGETRLLRIVNSDNSFSLMTFGTPYEGLIYKQYAGAFTQLTWIGYDSNGKDINFSRNNSTWYVNSLSSKMLRSRTVTGTTSATTGILQLDAGSDTNIVGAYAGPYMALPYFSSNTWRVAVIDSSSANGIVAVKDTNVTVTYYYY